MSRAAPHLAIPHPLLHVSHAGIWLRQAGETRAIDRREALRQLSATPTIIIAAPMVAQRLGQGEVAALDLLELFAFIHPARFAVPSVGGLADALGIAPDSPVADDAAPAWMERITAALIGNMGDEGWAERQGAWDMGQRLGRLRWGWAPIINGALTPPPKGEPSLFARMAEWSEEAPRPRPLNWVPDVENVTTRLRMLVASGEERPGQRAMAAAIAPIFGPRRDRHSPNLLLAEAGTGIGKTLAYLAASAEWVAASGGSVHISTYTKALQRQVARETTRLYPDAAAHRKAVVVRKGRENYLCLLNLEDALEGGFAGRGAIFAVLAARWAAYSRDGDMNGGDMPGWLSSLFRRAGAQALTDRRGECIYAACPHWRRCFIERSVRAAEQADFVIANHALTMIGALRGGGEGGARLIFDEGHHLFDAADSLFATNLSGQEAIELRRWIIGPESRHRGRRRGLAARLSDIASYDDVGGEALEAARDAALALPADGWLARIAGEDGATPNGPIEALLSKVRRITIAQNIGDGEADAGYGLEAHLPPHAGVDGGGDSEFLQAVTAAAAALDAILTPLRTLTERIRALLAEPPDWLDASARQRAEGSLTSLGARMEMLGAWCALLARILAGEADAAMVDWLAIERVEGRVVDVGIMRRWIDPTLPLARHIYAPAQSLLITSATLAMGDSARAEVQTGARHLPGDIAHFNGASPFDYARQSEIILINDVKRGDISALASAYARLIIAEGGGVLGLFTAIRRLRAVHGRIADALAREGIALYAQHVDPIDTGALVDLFRAEPKGALLGTDALRDGVDVPGEALRMVVMEQVPWNKPTIAHSARRLAAGAEPGGSTAAYDDALVRTRLAQAFGRLIRRADDFGRFILLTSALPSRLLSAFPPETPVWRLGLEDALARIASGRHGAPRQADSQSARG